MPERLLVVDDEPTLAELLSATLRFAGFSVGVATTGAEALASAENAAARPGAARRHVAGHGRLRRAASIARSDAPSWQSRQPTTGAISHRTARGSAVRIGVGCRGAHAMLEIADTGPGMTVEEASRVFERFCRADGSRNRAGGGGAGLGLAIVDSLVRAHGGRVELQTTPGHGATFRICVPAVNDADPEDQRATAPRPSSV